MEIGLRVFPNAPVRELVRVVQQAESAGFTHAWICDEGFTRDVYVTMAMMVAATTRMKFGTGITNPYSRHPSVTAVAAATLYEASGGRAFVGLGSGGNLALDPVGIAREQPLARCRDAMAIMRRIWSGEKAEYEGKTVAVRGAQIAFPCPGMEMWMGARGPQMIRLASQLADGVYLSGLPKAGMSELVTAIRAEKRQAPQPAKVAWVATVITDGATLRQRKPDFAYSLIDSPPAVRAQFGLTEGDVLHIKETLHSRGLEAVADLVPDAVVEGIAVVGTPGEAATEIQSMADRCGIDQVVINTDLFSRSFGDALEIAQRLQSVSRVSLQ